MARHLLALGGGAILVLPTARRAGIDLILKSGSVSSPHTNQDDLRLRLRASYLFKGALSRRRSKTTRSEEGYLAFATISSGQRVV